MVGGADDPGFGDLVNCPQAVLEAVHSGLRPQDGHQDTGLDRCGRIAQRQPYGLPVVFTDLVSGPLGVVGLKVAKPKNSAK